MTAAPDPGLRDNEEVHGPPRQVGQFSHPSALLLRRCLRRLEDRRPWRPGDGDTRCQGCGFRYQPWFTDNWLWNTVMGGDEFNGDPGGYLCPRCFANKAAEKHPNLVWRFIPEWSGKAPLMDFPAAPPQPGDADETGTGA